MKTSTRRMREASPLEQVRRMGVLQREVAKENSKSAKERMIGEYPELRGLLEQYVHLCQGMWLAVRAQLTLTVYMTRTIARISPQRLC